MYHVLYITCIYHANVSYSTLYYNILQCVCVCVRYVTYDGLPTHRTQTPAQNRME